MTSVAAGGLVGREAEATVTQRLLDALGGGQGATLLVEGEAGIGKTRFLEALANDAQSKGAVVCRGDAHPFEQARPFACVADALGLRSTSTDPRRAAIGRLLQVTTPRAGTTSADVGYRVVEHVVDLVEQECGSGPVLLVLEDLHWADISTLRVLRTISDRLAHVPLLVAASLRPEPRTAELDRLLDGLLRAGARWLTLEPLHAQDVERLAVDELGHPPGPALAKVLERAGGNPLWVVELLRSLAAEGRLQESPSGVEVTTGELPDSFRALVVRRLHELPGDTVELLRATSVLGHAVAVRDLAAAVRQPTDQVIAHLGPAFLARLLREGAETLTFRHELVRDAVYQDLARPVRRALHRRAATVLAASGADRLEVADHLVLGADRGDLEAIAWLREAAAQVAANAPATAVDLLRRAESLLPGAHDEADLVAAEIVSVLLQAGEVGEAAARAEAVLARRHRPEADRPLRMALVSALSLQNRADDLIEQTEAVLANAPDLPLADQALVLAQSSYGRTFSGDARGGEEAARRALDVAERSGAPAATVWPLTTLSVALKQQGRYGEAVALTRRATALAFEPPVLEARLRHPAFFHGMALGDCDRPAEARRAYDHAVEECEELGSAWLLPDILLMSAEARFVVGDWDDALSELEAGLQAAAEHGQRILVAQSIAYRALVEVARGEADARATLALLEVDPEAPTYGAQVVTLAAASTAEAEGDAVAAYDLLLRCCRRDAARSHRHHLRDLAPALVRLALDLDHPDVARWTTEVTEAGALLAPEVPTVQSAACRCRGLLEGDADAALEAAEHARRGQRLLAHAGACEDAARVLEACGRLDEARALLVEAVDRYEHVGASAWSARVAASLRRLGVRRGARGPRVRPARGWAGLTATERAVSRLVADGLTNREVAARLHISPHTVNSHLRHVFAKLDVSNRVALAAAVARTHDEAGGDIHSNE